MIGGVRGCEENSNMVKLFMRTTSLDTEDLRRHQNDAVRRLVVEVVAHSIRWCLEV